jgi:hypothetical protein
LNFQNWTVFRPCSFGTFVAFVRSSRRGWRAEKVAYKVRLTIDREGEILELEMFVAKRPLLPGGVPFARQEELSPMSAHGVLPRVKR